MQCRRITLDGAIRFYRNETLLRTQTLSLERDHLIMLRIDLRNDHRNIRSPTMRAVVGYHGGLRLGISILDGADLFLGHIHCGKYEIHLRGNLFYLVNIADGNIF